MSCKVSLLSYGFFGRGCFGFLGGLLSKRRFQSFCVHVLHWRLGRQLLDALHTGLGYSFISFSFSFQSGNGHFRRVFNLRVQIYGNA
jgi:hypothetical protein